MKIGEAILSIDFTDEEKNRLGNALRQNSSLPYSVITKKIYSINSNQFWRTQMKRFKVTGFREGHPGAKKQVLDKLFASLGVRLGSHCPEIWPIYRECACKYVDDEFPILNQLLLNESLLDGGNPLTEQIFISIRERMPLYEIEPDSLAQLYTLWGFPRTTKFQEIIGNNSISASITKELVTSRVIKLKKEIIKEVDLLKVKINKSDIFHEKEISSIKDKMLIIENSIEDLTDEIKKLSEKPYDSNSFYKHLPPNIITEKKSGINLDDIKALASRLDGFSKKIDSIESKIGLLKQERSTPKRDSKPHEATKFWPASIFQNWQQLCQQSGVEWCNESLLYLLFLMYRFNKIVITQQPFINEALFIAMGAEVKKIVASPLWISNADWKEAISFLKETSLNPKLLIIYDFDVAIQEGYLVPSLIDFINNKEMSYLGRIILVPCGEDFKQISPRVYEISCLLDRLKGYVTENSDRLKASYSKIIPQAEKLTAKQMIGYQASSGGSLVARLNAISKINGVVLTQKNIDNFSNAYGGLKQVLDERDSGVIALQTVLLPWVVRVQGEIKARIFEETLKESFGVVA